MSSSENFLRRLITRLDALFGRGLVMSMGVILAIGLTVSLGVFIFFNTAAPTTLTITSGPAGSSFSRNAEKYQKILAREGVTLKIAGASNRGFTAGTRCCWTLNAKRRNRPGRNDAPNC